MLGFSGGVEERMDDNGSGEAVVSRCFFTCDGASWINDYSPV